jgi:hypothetical protein
MILQEAFWAKGKGQRAKRNTANTYIATENKSRQLVKKVAGFYYLS